MIVTHSSQWKKVREEVIPESEKSKLGAQGGGQYSGDQKVSSSPLLFRCKLALLTKENER